jgi:hypothetical protein
MLITVENVLCKRKMSVSFEIVYFFTLISHLILLKRDGCPKIINLGSARTDLFYERKKYGFKKR